jgi:hypothetical protein
MLVSVAHMLAPIANAEAKAGSNARKLHRERVT